MNLLKLPDICSYEIYKNLSYEDIKQLQFVNGIIFRSLNSFVSKNFMVKLRRLYWEFQKTPSESIIEQIVYLIPQFESNIVEDYKKVCLTLGYNYKNFNNYVSRDLKFATRFHQKAVLKYLHETKNIHIDYDMYDTWYDLFHEYKSDIPTLKQFLDCPNCIFVYGEYHFFGSINNIELYEYYFDKHYHDLINDINDIKYQRMSKKKVIEYVPYSMNKKEMIEYVSSFNPYLSMQIIVYPIINSLKHNNLHFMKQLLKYVMYPELKKYQLISIIRYLPFIHIEEGLKYLSQYYDIQNCFLDALAWYSEESKFDCFNYLYKNLPYKFNSVKERSARLMIAELAKSQRSTHSTNLIKDDILCISFYTKYTIYTYYTDNFTKLKTKDIIGASLRNPNISHLPIGMKIICPLMTLAEIQKSLQNMDSLLDLDIAYHDPFLFWNLFYLSKDRTIENAVRQLVPGFRKEKRRKVEKRIKNN